MKFMGTLAGAALGLVMSTAASFAADVTLNYSSWLPLNHWLNQEELMPWFKRMEEATQGRVKIEVLPKVVGTANSQFDVVRDGLADISFIVTAYSPGRFPLAEMGTLPLLGSKPSKTALLFEQVYRENFWSIDEFKGVHLMSIWTITPNQVFNRTKPVKTLADIKGLKLRSPNDNITMLLNNVGGVPINKPSSEAYELLSTGAIDGQITQADTVVAQNMVPLTKFATIIPGGLTNATLAVIVNPDKWASISEADRKAIEDITTFKLSESIGKAYERREVSGMEVLTKAGYQVDVADDKFLADLAEAAKPVEAKWIELAKAKGIADPAAVLQKYRDGIKAVEKTN